MPPESGYIRRCSCSIDGAAVSMCHSAGMSWLDENPNCARTHAAFRLLGSDLDPAAVTQALGLEPCFALAKRQEIPAGRVGMGRRQRTGVWSLSTEAVVASTSLERHLIHLLNTLDPAAAALHAVLTAENISADFFCYWLSATGHGGPEVSPETLSRIGALNASLGIDFYGPLDEAG
jgi:hypothetical protein